MLVYALSWNGGGQWWTAGGDVGVGGSPVRDIQLVLLFSGETNHHRQRARFRSAERRINIRFGSRIMVIAFGVWIKVKCF